MEKKITDVRHAVSQTLYSVLFCEKHLSRALLTQHERLKSFSKRDKRFAYQLVSVVIRRLGQIDSVLDKFLKYPVKEKNGKVQTLLRLGAAQILFLGTPPYAAVNQTVQLATGSLLKYRALINAVLREIIRNQHSIKPILENPLGALPCWLAESWCKSYGTQIACSIAAANLLEPPLDLTSKQDPGTFVEALNGKLLPTKSIRLFNAGEVQQLPGYSEGNWWVQDAAASVPAQLLIKSLNVSKYGRAVIDLCAAPGGKTAQLCSANLKVTAIDNDSKRIKRLKENLDRLGFQAKVIKSDALSWRPSKPPAGILLDAPCSGTGTLRRQPDIAWHRKPREIVELAELQRRLLRQSIENLPLGGVLVYAVCSLEKEEGVEQANNLLLSDNLKILPIKQEEMPGLQTAITSHGYVQTLPNFWPDLGGLDGFFIARFVKQKD